MHYIIYNIFIILLYFKKNKVVVATLLCGFVNVLLYNYSCLLYNLSFYYQIICILNTKNNFIYIIFVILLIKVNFKIDQGFFLIALFCLSLWNSNFSKDVNLFYFMWLDCNIVQTNTNLLNGLMLIHPWLLYMYYSLGIYTCSILLFKFLFFDLHRIYIINSYMVWCTALVLFSLFLGCWWAEQELSWGGWWSWDFVELLALTILSCLLWNIHQKISMLLGLSLYKQIYLVQLLILLSIVSVRFNIINSVHNFISIQSQNQFLVYIYIVFILLLFRLIQVIYQLYNYKKKSAALVFVNIFLVAIMYTYLYYLETVSNNFCFLSKLDVSVFYYLISLVLILLLGIYPYNIIKIYILYITLICNQVTVISFVILLFLKKNFLRKNYIHVIIVVFFYLCLSNVYVFDFFTSNNYINSIKCLKMNDVFIVNSFFLKDISLSSYSFFVKDNIFLCAGNPLNLVEGVGTFIFEKVLFLKNIMTVMELYNYNHQYVLVQNGWPIWLSLVLIFKNFLFFCVRKHSCLTI